jgi:uncharacterized protein (TIGR02145 family)
VTWTSSDNSIATVADDGVVSAVAAGAATITATAGEQTATCAVTVTPVAVTGISLDKTTLPLTIGETYTLTATVSPDNATDKTVTWTSSDNSVANVAGGVVTAVADGVATITATAGGQTATCTVTVLDGVRINGVIWAKSNVDAPGTFAATPEALGKFYQWNRATAWAVTGTVENWDNSSEGGNSWTADICPDGWRVPTSAELLTLLDTEKVTREWKSSGVRGYLFTDKITNATLFLPAVGYRHFTAGLLQYQDSYCRYWSSTTNHEYANLLDVHTDYANVISNSPALGLSVRCVAE